MKKIMLFAASMAMAVMLTGCGGSPSSVAEKFMNAIIQRDVDKAVGCIDTNATTPKEIKALKELLDAAGKALDDNKLEAVAFYEEVVVPAEGVGYKLINGAKYTGEEAEVKVQFKKGKDLKSNGMKVELVKVDGSWKVKDNVMKFSELKDLDTEAK